MMNGNNLDAIDTMLAIANQLDVKVICHEVKFIRFDINDFPEWRFSVENYFEGGVYIIGEHIDMIDSCFMPNETTISCENVSEFLDVIEDMKKRPNTYFCMAYYYPSEYTGTEEEAKAFKKQYDSDKETCANIIKSYEEEIDKILYYAMKLGKGKIFKGFGFYGKVFCNRTVNAIMHPGFIKDEHQVHLASGWLREKLYDCYTKYKKMLKDGNYLFFHDEFINNYMFLGSSSVTCIDKLYRYSVPYRILTQEKEIYN